MKLGLNRKEKYTRQLHFPSKHSKSNDTNRPPNLPEEDRPEEGLVSGKVSKKKMTNLLGINPFLE